MRAGEIDMHHNHHNSNNHDDNMHHARSNITNTYMHVNTTKYKVVSKG